jgi:hypothetical protein
MINAKKELVKELDNIAKRYSVSVKCALVTYESHYKESHSYSSLPIGFELDEFLSFLEELDFDYNNGHGGQHLHGTVWFDDGSWMERGEYDGSEWWEYKTTPEIPEDLKCVQ